MSTTSKSGCTSPEASDSDSRPVPSSLATPAGVLCGWSFSPVLRFMGLCSGVSVWSMSLRMFKESGRAPPGMRVKARAPEAAISLASVSRRMESKVRRGPSKRTKRCVSTPSALNTPASSTVCARVCVVG